MGLLKDLVTLNRQAHEINRSFDPGAQARQGLERMRRMNVILAGQTEALGLTRAGLSATASILGVSDTGTRINDVPLVRLSLLVHCGDRPPYPVHTDALLPVNAWGQCGVGQRVALMVDPENRDSVLVRWGQPVS
jgi:hypothetical protein